MTYSLTITDSCFFLFTPPLPSNPISHQLSHREGFLFFLFHSFFLYSCTLIRNVQPPKSYCKPSLVRVDNYIYIPLNNFISLLFRSVASWLYFTGEGGRTINGTPYITFTHAYNHIILAILAPLPIWRPLI